MCIRDSSGDWLFALPTASCGLRLDDEAVRIGVSLRLGLPLSVPHQCRLAMFMVLLLHVSQLQNLCLTVINNVSYSVARLRQLEMRTWLWADCQNLTRVDISLRSAVWLLTYLTKYHTSRFVIVLTIHSNYALEYTLDHVLQVSDELPFALVLKQNNKKLNRSPHLYFAFSKIISDYNQS